MQTITISSFSRPPIFSPPIENPMLPRAIYHRRPSLSSLSLSLSSSPRPQTALFSVPRRRDRGGDSVDEGMITLRKRIREMRDAEEEEDDGDAPAPSDWAEWERRYYEEQYLSDVCEIVGLVQTVLMSTRPSVAVGLIAMVGLSVPTALILIAMRLAEASGPLISSVLMHGN